MNSPHISVTDHTRLLRMDCISKYAISHGAILAEPHISVVLLSYTPSMKVYTYSNALI